MEGGSEMRLENVPIDNGLAGSFGPVLGGRGSVNGFGLDTGFCGKSGFRRLGGVGRGLLDRLLSAKDKGEELECGRCGSGAGGRSLIDWARGGGGGV